MFSQNRGEPPAVPLEAFLRVRSLCSTGHFSEAINVLDTSCSLSTGGESSVLILSHLGRTALEERNYGLAYHAYQSAFEYAQRASVYGPLELLGLLCDSVELTSLAFPQSKFLGNETARTALEDSIGLVLSAPHHPVPPELISKIIVAAGEVGSNNKITELLDEYLNGRYSSHLNSAATEGLLELLWGHEVAILDQLQGFRLLHEAEEAYLNAGRKLRSFPEYAPLVSYALLCAGRAVGMMQERSGAELYLEEAAREFVSLPPELRSVGSAARILDSIAGYAALAPYLRGLYQKVFEQTDLPVHHLISALVLWSQPYCITARLRETQNPEQRDQILEDTHSMIQRAEQLSQDVLGVTNIDRVLLSVAKVHLASHDEDSDKALASLREGLCIAAVDPRGIDLVFPYLVQVAWDDSQVERAPQLISMFTEILEIAPRPGPYAEEIADFKSQLVVGIVNSLNCLELPPEHKAQRLSGALDNLVSYLKRRRYPNSDEVRVFSHILEHGVRLVVSSAQSESRTQLLCALRDFYCESPSRLDRVGSATLSWLRHALVVELQAVSVYACLGEVSRYAASFERAERLRHEIDMRVNAGEGEQQAEEEFPDDDSPW